MNLKETGGGVIEAKQKRSRLKQAKILTATSKLLAERSIDQLSVSEIAKEAGVPVGTFYQRFADKQALIQSLFRQYEEDRFTELAASMDPARWKTADLTAATQGVVGALVDHYAKNRGLIRAYVQHYHANPAETETSAFSERVAKLYNLAVAAIAPHQRPKDERTIRFGLFAVMACLQELIVFASEAQARRLPGERAKIVRDLTQLMLGYMRSG